MGEHSSVAVVVPVSDDIEVEVGVVAEVVAEVVVEVVAEVVAEVEDEVDFDVAAVLVVGDAVVGVVVDDFPDLVLEFEVSPL